MSDEGTMSEDGGRGDGLAHIKALGGQPRRALNLLHRAVSQGWPVGQDTRDRTVPVLERLAFGTDTDDRTRLKAIECLRVMCRDNVEAAVHLDRVERLETGDATDRIEFAPMRF